MPSREEVYEGRDRAWTTLSEMEYEAWRQARVFETATSITCALVRGRLDVLAKEASSVGRRQHYETQIVNQAVRMANRLVDTVYNKDTE